MKKVLFLSVLFFAFITISCSEEPAMDNKTYETNLDCNLQKLNVVFNSLDSLNAKYPSQISRGVPKRKRICRDYLDLADEAGGVCGRYVGRWIGTAIGSATAGPAGACIGYVWGWKAGQVAGYIGASAAAKKYFDCAGLAEIVRPGMFPRYNSKINVSRFFRHYIDEEYVRLYMTDSMFPEDTSITLLSDDLIHSGDVGELLQVLPVSEEMIIKCDSIGYYHNWLMAYFEDNAGQYVKNSEPDLEKIYDYIVAFLTEAGFDDDGIFENMDLRNKIISIYSNLGLMALNSNTVDDYLNLQYLYMSGDCQISQDDIELYKNFDVKIIKKCNELSLDEIESYAEELNKIISNADVSSQLRVDLAFSAQAAINTAICWHEN